MKNILLISMIYFFTHTMFAQYGELDPSFGTNGKVTLNTSAGFDNGSKMFVLEDGKIIVTGTGTEGVSKFLIARYLPDGILDTDFGTDGITLTQIGTGNTYGVSGLLQTDGKIVIAGSAEDGDNSIFAIARFDSNGSLDESFADNGIFTTSLVDGQNTVTDIALQSDGKIVICGYTGTDLQEDFALCRINSNGSIDQTFGDNGKLVFDISGGIDEAKAMDLTPDGKILVSGYSADEIRILVATLVQFNNDGTPDTDFGNNGVMIVTPGPLASDFFDLKHLDNGKILAVGNLDYDGQYDFLATRFFADGSIDTEFADNGFFTKDFENTSNHASSLIVQPDEKIILVGYHGIWPTSSFALLRLDENGERDNTFGDEGLTVTSFFGGYDYSVGSVLQSDGKLIACGTAGQGSDYMLGMARYTTGIAVGINESFQLQSSSKIFPNPAINSTKLNLELKSTCKVSVKLFNISGREIKTLVEKAVYKKGQHQFTINLRDVTSGIYFLNVSTETNSQILKLIKQ